MLYAESIEETGLNFTLYHSCIRICLIRFKEFLPLTLNTENMYNSSLSNEFAVANTQ
jgi:hypothetical protein